MRDLIIELIQDTDTGVYTLSQELPYSADGTPLYVKNLKKIYVDMEQFNTDPILQTLDNNAISTMTYTVRVYMANEARMLPSYTDVVTNLIDIKDAAEIRALGYSTRRCQVSTEFADNILTTTFEFQFSKYI